MRAFHISVSRWFSNRVFCDSKSPQVSRTILSILGDINNAVVWTVSTSPVISKSSSPCTNPLVTISRAPITIGITITFMFHSFFQFPSKIEIFTLLFTFNFTLWSVGNTKVQNSASSLFVDYYKIWSSGRDLVIRLYLKIPEEFVCLILQDRFWVVSIRFVRVVKLQFLAQFPVDHLAHPVVSSLIHHLC